MWQHTFCLDTNGRVRRNGCTSFLHALWVMHWVVPYNFDTQWQGP